MYAHSQMTALKRVFTCDLRAVTIKHNTLHSMRWFFPRRRGPPPPENRSRTKCRTFLFFLSLVTLTFNLDIRTRRDFCRMHLTAKFHHPTFNSCNLSCWQTNKQTDKMTNRCRWKHPPRSAMLRGWANIYFASGSDCKVLWWVCLSVGLSVRISPEPHARSLTFFCACCLCQWLCPPPTCWRAGARCVKVVGPMNKWLNFAGDPVHGSGYRYGPHRDTGKTSLGGGMHCPSASSFFGFDWVSYATRHRTVLTIFPLILQTIIIAQMTSTGD